MLEYSFRFPVTNDKGQRRFSASGSKPEHREQLQRIYPLHFEQEGADNKLQPLELRMMKEAYVKLHIKIETRAKN